jgi:predicted permease
MAALRPWECNLTGDGEPERLGGARVSSNFFSVLGVSLARGRGFSPDHEQPGKEKVIVISEALWRRRYGADPALIGRTIDVNGESHIVAGIAPASLLVPTGTQLHPLLPFGARVDVWKPIAPGPRELQGESWDHGLFVRLKQGEDMERGRQQLQAILNRMIGPASREELITRVVPVRDIYTGRVRLRLLLVFAASALLLLIACTNLANLLLARAAGRAAEFATRVALGAGRARILLQTLTESTVLALLGGVLGVVAATAASTLLAAHGPEEVRQLAGTGVNWLVFGFALAIALLTGLVCGSIPARHMFTDYVAARMQEGSRTTSGGRAIRSRRILVAVQVALCGTLLGSAGLLLQSFSNVMRADRGYHVERILAVDLSLFGQRYASGESRIAFYRQLAADLQSIPGVVAAGAVSDLPAAGPAGASRAIFHSTDTDFRQSVRVRPVALVRSVTSGYFAASGTSLRAGRFLSTSEPVPVALISESLARGLFPGERPESIVGRAIRQGNVTGPLITVAGVVQDVRPGAVDRELPPIIYRPHEQWASGPATLVVRTSQDPAAIAQPVRAAIRKADASLPIPAIRTMREIVSEAVSQRRFQMMLTSVFAMVALLLGATGVYGVVNYTVACRTRDVGVRLALGATRMDIMRSVFSDGMRPVLIGLVAGLAGAVATAVMLRNQLFGTSPVDPLAFSMVSLILLLTSGLATYVPARRAARLDPIVALRQQ